MKDSTKFLILSLLGVLCYIGYVILVCSRGPILSDFIVMSVHMFVWLSVAIVPDLLKLIRIEKEEKIKNYIKELQDNELECPQVNEYEIIIDDEEED